MTARLRHLTEKAEKLALVREAHRRMVEGLRRREILDLQAEAEGIDWVIEAARSIHAGDDDSAGWVADVEASLRAAEARHEAGERARRGESRSTEDHRD